MQLKQLAAQLQTLGLSEKQSRVYVASVFLGPAPAQRIAEQAGINRPTAYDILEELGKLGLISRTIEGSKTIFIPAGNTALADMVQRQAREIEQRRKSLDTLLPELATIEHTATDDSPDPEVRFVRGKKGVDAIFAYAVRKAKPGTEILGMTNRDETLKVYPDRLKTNPTIRLNKKMSSKQFYSSSAGTYPSDPAILKEAAKLASPIAADITLYEDKAVLLSYGKEWTGIIIENKDIVGTLRQLFYMAWQNIEQNSQKTVDKN